MSPTAVTAETAFANIMNALGDKPGVSKPDALAGSTPRPRFGASALRVEGRIFAMVSRGRLVLKLPAERVAELIASGGGGPYDAGRGRPMKEWVSLEPARQDHWLMLATEALEFVGSTR